MGIARYTTRTLYSPAMLGPSQPRHYYYYYYYYYLPICAAAGDASRKKSSSACGGSGLGALAGTAGPLPSGLAALPSGLAALPSGLAGSSFARPPRRRRQRAVAAVAPAILGASCRLLSTALARTHPQVVTQQQSAHHRSACELRFMLVEGERVGAFGLYIGSGAGRCEIGCTCGRRLGADGAEGVGAAKRRTLALGSREVVICKGPVRACKRRGLSGDDSGGPAFRFDRASV